MERAMIKPELNPLFNFPACYHPTTVISIDDDQAFLDTLSDQLVDRLALLCFNEPEKALDYTKKKHNYLPFKERCFSNDASGQLLFHFESIRNEIYNKDRFKEIFINVTDYDMPHINGIEVTNTMQFKENIPRYAHIFLTGKVSNDFKEMVRNKDYIGKDDPEFITNMLKLIEEKAVILFSNYSHEVALNLSKEQNEKPTVLFDGNFSSIFNHFVVENNICEFYLFDRQGSYMMLDEDANLSWLFVRNDEGLQNSIHFAKEKNAPQSIIDALLSKNFILSLYEKPDIESCSKINWDDFLIPAESFESNGKYLDFFSHTKNKETPVYYYAYTKNFPTNSIKKDNILSYSDFLNQQE